MQKAWSNTKRGFSIVEALLGAALFALIVTALVGAYLYGQESTALAGNRARAIELAEEGLEAVRNIRDAGFANLTDGTYGLATTGSQWSLFGSQDLSDIFSRQIVISTIDSKRKLVTANVSWQQNAQRAGSVTLATRMTYWMEMVSNWANPGKEGSFNLSGTTNASKIQVVGNYAYLVRPSATPDFLIFDISNTASPTLAGSLPLIGVADNLYVSGNYAYIVSNDTGGELKIVNISNPASPTLTSTFNIPGTAAGNGVFVSGTTAYVVKAVSAAENEFVSINVANPASPVLLGSLDLGAAAFEVSVSGNYAYVASGSNTQELQVVDISTPASPTLAGSLNLAGTSDALTIALSGTTALLGQGASGVTVNISTPANPALLGTLTTTGVINDIALDFGNSGAYAYLATSDTTAEFKVIDMSIPSSPAILGSYDVTGLNSLLGMAYSQSKDRAFAGGISDTEELLVLMPQ